MRPAAWIALVIAAAGCDEADPCALEVPGTVCRIAGTGQRGFDGDGRLATRTSFYLPSQARRGPDGLLYIMDFNNMRLRRVDADGRVETVAGNGIHMGAIEGLAAVDSSLESPVDLDFLPDGRLAFVSSHDPRLLAIGADGLIQTIAGTGLGALVGNEGDNGPATGARFVELSGLAVAADGTIYVADRGANRIRKISGGVITTLYGTGVASVLKEPEQLAVDAAGNVLVADAGNNVIRRITPSGEATIIAGTLISGFSGDGGPAVAAQLAGPTGIDVAADGTLYVADRFNRRVRQIDVDGTITTIAGTGSSGPSGDFGPAVDAEFGFVSRVDLDEGGGLLVADQSNHCIREIMTR